MRGENWTNAPLDRRLSVLLASIDAICTVSESAQQVMNLTRAGNDVSLTAVVDAVMKDPALAAEILKIANSPLFGQARQVYDLKRAVVVVGMQELHNIAAAMSMMAAFSTPEPLSKSLRDGSVLSAAVARLLARKLGMTDESQAFLSGLLAEIGAMACVAIDGENYKKIWNEANGRFETRSTLESERYTASSEEIGYHVLIGKQIPEVVAEAIKQTSREENLLASITSFSRWVAPLIIKAANENNAAIVQNDIPTLYKSLQLPELASEELIQICIAAAELTELSLRGEMSLVDGDENSEQAAHILKADPSAQDISEIIHTETAERKTLEMEAALHAKPAVRMGAVAGEPTFVKGMVAVGIVLAIAAAIVAYLYF